MNLITHQNFIDLLKKYRDQVWPVIEGQLPSVNIFDKYTEPDKKYKYLLDKHLEMMSVYPRRMGKYFRPSMVIMTGEALGISPDKLLITAAAQQLSEEWILMHDDIEDDSQSRRGGETLHNIYSKELAINSGDAIHALMWRMLQLNRKVIGDEKTFQVMEEFSKMLNRTVLGQTIEIKWGQENKQNLSDEDILLILEGKTGYYTVAGPMRLGAIIAGATKKQLEKIYHYGKLTGCLFQIKDDMLDLTSDFQGLKQQTGNDIYEGKRTIMLAHLMRTVSGSDKKILDEILKKNRFNKTEDEIKWVISKMSEYGSFNHATALMKNFASEAEIYFKKEMSFLKYKPSRDYLEYLPQFLLNRDH